MCQRRVEVCNGLAIFFYSARQTIQAPEAINLIAMSQSSSLQRASQYSERFIIRFEWNWKRVPVLASVCEGEACRVRESARRSMHDLGYQSERLQRPWTESFHKQQRSKVAEILLVRYRKHRPKPLQVNILCSHIMMCGHR
jgi:hypothetical protein